MAIDLATLVFSSLEHVRRCKGILENDPNMWSIIHSYQFQIHSQTTNRHSNPVDQLQGVGQTPEQKKHTESFTVKKHDQLKDFRQSLFMLFPTILKQPPFPKSTGFSSWSFSELPSVGVPQTHPYP